METHAAGDESGMDRPPSALAPRESAFENATGSVSDFTSSSRAPDRWRYHPPAQSMPLARALGWFSIGLGIAQLIAPRGLSRATTGTHGSGALMRTLGMREIVSGVGILSRKQPAGWLWSRVAGDAMDLALLGTAAMSPRSRRNRVAIAAAAVAGVTMLDVLTSVQQARRERKQGAHGARSAGDDLYVETSIAINKSPQECYAYWRDFQNLPRFMEHLESVEVLSETRSHWKARAPGGGSVEWDAEVTADERGELLAWHSTQDAQVENAGTVRFETAPGKRGTIVRVDLQYRPPAGLAGAMVAKVLGEEPSQQVADDLRHFKWLIETGVIPTTVGQTSGPRSALGRLFRKGAPG